MDKTSKLMHYAAAGLGFLATLFFILPLYTANGSVFIGAQIIFGFKEANLDIFSFLAFLLPSTASMVLLIKTKHSESVSMLLFLLSGLVLIAVPEFTDFFNKSLGLTIIVTTYVIPIVFSFVASLFCLTLAIRKNEFSTYQIVEMAMLVGIAIVLDLPGLKIKLPSGSIGFTMVPLFILVLLQGPIKGFIGAGLVYGFVTCVLDGWGLATFPLDYMLGYGSLALLGIFKSYILNDNTAKFNLRGVLYLSIGVIISIAGRLLASTISGVIYYEVAFWPSMAINAVPILSSAGIVLVMLIGLYDPLIRVSRLLKNRLS
jgi:thiamine transporter ThiT